MKSTSEAGSPSHRASRARTLWHLIALFTLQDALLLGYLVITWILVWRMGPGEAQAKCAEHIFVCIAAVSIACLWARTPEGMPPTVKWVIYRAALTGVLLENYLMLRDLLPLVRPDAVDASLLRVDVAVLGFEPALWLERFNRTPVVEYFAFFYFSYFFICIAFLLAIIVFSPGGKQTTEFAIGTLIVFCIGQIGYIAVPAFGPVRYLASSYAGPLNGGFFWGCVTKTVEAGSAMKDVFPSLHTAVPTWLTLFSLRRAGVDRRWRWPARAVGFFAANIIVSTMLLRWHYAIDVVAGLTLAAFAAFASGRLTRIEEAFRRRHGFAQAWSFSGSTTEGPRVLEIPGDGQEPILGPLAARSPRWWRR
jgi:hypothetical protein